MRSRFDAAIGMDSWPRHWKKKLARRGFNVAETDEWDPVRARKQAGDYVVTADVGPVDEASMLVVVIKAIFSNPDRFRFSVHPTSAASEVLATFGLFRDHQVGHRAFDDRFLIRTNDTHTLDRLFEQSDMGQIQGVDHYLDLRIVDERGSGRGPRLPDGLDELMLQARPADLNDTSTLGTLLHAFESVLSTLPAVLFERPEPVDAIAARLLGTVGGRIQDDYLLWDGDPPRFRFIEEIEEAGDRRGVAALCALLDDGNRELAERALQALRTLGSAEAVPSVIAQLGRYAAGGDWGYHDLVVKFLREQGEGELAGAFDRVVLHGEPLFAPLQRHPDDVGRALVRVLDTGLTFSAASAARALGELGLRWAEPAVRRAARRLAGLSPAEQKMFDDAIAAMERWDALPRPAGTPAHDEQLPRAVEQTGVATDALPQPVADPDAKK